MLILNTGLLWNPNLNMMLKKGYIMSTETILLEELVEKKTSLILQPLSSYNTDRTSKGDKFNEEHGKKGIYIAFLRKVGHEHAASLPNNISALTLFKNLFEKDYINGALYIGSGNILDRCGAMRGNSMNSDPHGVSKYRNANPDIEKSDIDVLSILMGDMLPGDIKDYETKLHDINIERTGKRGFAHDYSSSNGENGTKMSQLENLIYNVSQDEWDSAFLMLEKRGTALNMERLHSV